MTRKMSAWNRLLLFAVAPFAGALLMISLWAQSHIELESYPTLPELQIDFSEPVQEITSLLRASSQNVIYIHSTIAEVFENYQRSAASAAALVQTAVQMKNRPMIVYDRRILKKLGTPVKQVRSDQLELALFPLKEKHYDGYAVKVNLRKDDAMKMVLGYDTLGKGETTESVAKRYGATAAINAGGFADDRTNGGRYPLSTTMLNGKFLTGFEPSFSDLFFVGLNDKQQLIGGKFKEKEELEQLNPKFGASFVPILLKNGRKQPIPKKWQTSPHRAARTVIANYKHDHLLFLIINGNDRNGNFGATLAEVQTKLVELGVVDAYNLDGGGSTSLVINGEVMNRPSDGKLRPLATHFLFFK